MKDAFSVEKLTKAFFEEYKEVVEDILDTDVLTDKEANKIRKYIAKLKNISPTSPVLAELNILFLSKLK